MLALSFSTDESSLKNVFNFCLFCGCVKLEFFYGRRTRTCQPCSFLRRNTSWRPPSESPPCALPLGTAPPPPGHRVASQILTGSAEAHTRLDAYCLDARSRSSLHRPTMTTGADYRVAGRLSKILILTEISILRSKHPVRSIRTAENRKVKKKLFKLWDNTISYQTYRLTIVFNFLTADNIFFHSS
jgi:hypothetical protein